MFNSGILISSKTRFKRWTWVNVCHSCLNWSVIRRGRAVILIPISCLFFPLSALYFLCVDRGMLFVRITCYCPLPDLQIGFYEIRTDRIKQLLNFKYLSFRVYNWVQNAGHKPWLSARNTHLIIHGDMAYYKSDALFLPNHRSTSHHPAQ